MILLHGLTSLLLWALGTALVVSVLSFLIMQSLIGKYKRFIFKNYSDTTKSILNIFLLLFTLAISITIFWITASAIDIIGKHYK
jgi:ABC-type spermidine/putrescine transport system permease subunit I